MSVSWLLHIGSAMMQCHDFTHVSQLDLRPMSKVTPKAMLAALEMLLSQTQHIILALVSAS